ADGEEVHGPVLGPNGARPLSTQAPSRILRGATRPDRDVLYASPTLAFLPVTCGTLGEFLADEFVVDPGFSGFVERCEHGSLYVRYKHLLPPGEKRIPLIEPANNVACPLGRQSVPVIQPDLAERLLLLFGRRV